MCIRIVIQPPTGSKCKTSTYILKYITHITAYPQGEMDIFIT